jgi:LmbE family N-acetylglucosaminyl deacetylase
VSICYDEIYLSPHLDDAALSCGGRIAKLARNGQKVLVVTVTAGDPLAGPLSRLARVAHRYWSLPEGAVGIRRAEDAEACTALGIQWLHWPLPDCIYLRDRSTGRNLYGTNAEIYGPIHPADAGRAAALQQLMGRLPPAVHVLAPLAIGNHVDHQLTRLAAERTWRKSLSYYEDYPYSASSTAAPFFAEFDEHWSTEVYWLSEAHLEAKVSAIAKYVSQVPALFGNTGAMKSLMIARADALGGERYWRRGPFPNRFDTTLKRCAGSPA